MIGAGREYGANLGYVCRCLAQGDGLGKTMVDEDVGVSADID